jgi:glycerol-3-phosphate acyltransferase PlsX
MLGLNGLVVKTHGSAKAVEVKNSILQCVNFKTHNVDDKIKETLNNKD